MSALTDAQLALIGRIGWSPLEVALFRLQTGVGEQFVSQPGLPPAATASTRPPRAAALTCTRPPVAREPARHADHDLLASWDSGRGDGQAHYVLLDDRDVDGDLRAAAELGKRFACLHLGLERVPRLRFYRGESDAEAGYRQKYGAAEWPGFRGGPMGGHADRASHSLGIRVTGDDSARWFADVAAHEVRHLAQSEALAESRDEAETDATAYGRWAAGFLVPDYAEPVERIHACDDGPHSGLTLAGVARHGDALVVRSDTSCAWRNRGTLGSPRWVPHHASCPVR